MIKRMNNEDFYELQILIANLSHEESDALFWYYEEKGVEEYSPYLLKGVEVYDSLEIIKSNYEWILSDCSIAITIEQFLLILKEEQNIDVVAVRDYSNNITSYLVVEL